VLTNTNMVTVGNVWVNLTNLK